MAHAAMAHKYDWGPGRECVHWEARRKQRTVDKREEAMQEQNVSIVNRHRSIAIGRELSVNSA